MTIKCEWSPDQTTLTGIKAAELGTAGAFLSYVAYQEGMAKTPATILDLWGAVTEIQQVGDVNLGEFSKALLAAAPVCSISKGAVALVQAGGRLADGKFDLQTVGTAAKAVEAAGDVAGWAARTGAWKASADAVYAAKTVKGVSSVLADVITIHDLTGAAVEKIKKAEKTDTKEVHEARESENFWATVRAVAGLALHAVVAAPAIFLFPVAPFTVTLLGTVYTIAITVHHFVKASTDDLIARTDAARANSALEQMKNDIAVLRRQAPSN